MVSSQTGELTWLNNNHPWGFYSQNYFQPDHFLVSLHCSHTTLLLVQAVTGQIGQDWDRLEINTLLGIICQNSNYKHSTANLHICCHRRKVSVFPHAIAAGCADPCASSGEHWILCWAGSTHKPSRKLFTFWRILSIYFWGFLPPQDSDFNYLTKETSA